MMKNKCPECGRGKAKRACGLKGGIIICPVCCSSFRSAECEECGYYEASNNYREGKKKKIEFTIMFDPEIEARCDEALALARTGKVKKAEKLFAELIGQHPYYHTVQYGMGVCHAMQSRFEDSIEYFNRAIKIFPYFAEAHFNLGLSYYFLFDLAKSFRALKAAIQFDLPPDHLAEAKRLLAKLENVITNDQSLALEAGLRNMETFDIAFETMKKGEFDKALALFNAVLSVTPDHHPSWGNKGLAYAGLGKKREALACFDKALELDPSYEIAAVNKIMVEGLKEGECIKQVNSAYYARDYEMKKRSYLAEFLQRFKK